MKNIYFIVLSVLLIIYIIVEIRKKRFSIKESFWWIMTGLVMLILSIFPHSIDFFASLLGIAYPPSLLFTICIIFLGFMNFRISKKVIKQQEQIKELEENLSLVKSKK